MMEEMWNERYSAEEYVYGIKPNQFFAESIRKLSPGTILLPADGEGRNGVFAATLGWKVHSFDQSKVGREEALKLAKQNNVDIEYDIATVPGMRLEEGKYNSIAMIFFHLPPTLRTEFHHECITSLAPGGHIILEAFHKKQLGLNSGGPKSEELLYTIEDLYSDFLGMEFEVIEQVRIHIEEGPYHDGEAEVVRMLATRSVC